MILSIPADAIPADSIPTDSAILTILLQLVLARGSERVRVIVRARVFECLRACLCVGVCLTEYGIHEHALLEQFAIQFRSYDSVLSQDFEVRGQTRILRCEV